MTNESTYINILAVSDNRVSDSWIKSLINNYHIKKSTSEMICLIYSLSCVYTWK